jgi:hypothetical protein
MVLKRYKDLTYSDNENFEKWSELYPELGELCSKRFTTPESVVVPSQVNYTKEDSGNYL